MDAPPVGLHPDILCAVEFNNLLSPRRPALHLDNTVRRSMVGATSSPSTGNNGCDNSLPASIWSATCCLRLPLPNCQRDCRTLNQRIVFIDGEPCTLVSRVALADQNRGGSDKTILPNIPQFIEPPDIAEGCKKAKRRNHAEPPDPIGDGVLHRSILPAVQ